jgi:hypothetical protein
VLQGLSFQPSGAIVAAGASSACRMIIGVEGGEYQDFAGIRSRRSLAVAAIPSTFGIPMSIKITSERASRSRTARPRTGALAR